VARTGEARLPPPGGDFIGRRRLDPHLDALRALGAQIHLDRVYEMWAPQGLSGCDLFMDEASVMATENTLMAAALTQGTTTIRNAASEPHVQNLARLLVRMGARIDGIGSNVLTVHGQKRLGGAQIDIAPDHIEVGSFMGLAAVTGGEMRIRNTVPDDLVMIRMVFERLGLKSHVEDDDLVVPPEQRLRVRDDVGGAIPTIDDGPWPAFPADLTSIALAVATQAEGMILIHEKMFENRLVFVDKLIPMGARVVVCDPHRAIVSGPSRLHGERMDSPDIRAGMAMLIASLCAEGVSEIGNVGQIDRGYERIDDRLRDLGARIERVSTDRVSAAR
jgi:UDP-N-acetylglucosamine 1-carboxyvinyltransferase